MSAPARQFVTGFGSVVGVAAVALTLWFALGNGSVGEAGSDASAPAGAAMMAKADHPASKPAIAAKDEGPRARDTPAVVADADEAELGCVHLGAGAEACPVSDDAQLEVCASQSLTATADDGAVVGYGCQPIATTFIEDDDGSANLVHLRIESLLPKRSTSISIDLKGMPHVSRDFNSKLVGGLLRFATGFHSSNDCFLLLEDVVNPPSKRSFIIDVT